MTKYVGVDIGKKSHVACVLNETNKLSKRLKFSSTQEGYQKFKTFLTENSCTNSDSGSGNCIIGLEATGHYWFTLFEKLKADQFEVFVLNPLQVQSFRNESIRGSKTDDLDCQLIAKVLKFGVGHSTSLPNEQLFELKELSRFRSDLIQRISSLK